MDDQEVKDQTTEEQGTGQSDDATDTKVADDVKAAEAEAQAQKHQFDKDRQQEQQQLANANRRIAELEQEVTDKPAGDVQDPDEENPLEVLKQLRETVKTLEASQAATRQELSNNQFNTAYADALTGFDREFGAEHRNAAIDSAKSEAIRRGYSLKGNDGPAFTELSDLVKMGYMQASGGEPAKAPAGTKTKAAPKADIGRAGQAIGDNPGRFKGTPDAVLADMQSKGRFRNLTIEE